MSIQTLKELIASTSNMYEVYRFIDIYENQYIKPGESIPDHKFKTGIYSAPIYNSDGTERKFTIEITNDYEQAGRPKVVRKGEQFVAVRAGGTGFRIINHYDLDIVGMVIPTENCNVI